MSWEDKEDSTIYKVVINHEEQYSIWPVDQDNPLGWKDVGNFPPHSMSAIESRRDMAHRQASGA